MRPSLPLLLSMSLALAACIGTKTITFISPDGKIEVPLLVEVADSSKERAQGLMGRTALEEGHGMLFAFKEPVPLQFWMKDTLIPLEILFFEAEGNFVNALTMEPCKEEPCARYFSASVAQYAVEVSPGFREKNGIGVGWKIDVERAQKLSKPE